MLRIKNPNSSRLPSEYQEVEYIESTGTQYIDTLYKANSEKVKFTIKFIPTTNAKSKALWGVFRSDKTSMIINAYVIADGTIRFFVGGTDGLTSMDYNFTANTLYDLTCEANNGNFVRTINGSSASVSYSGTLNKTDTLLIFAQKDGSTNAVSGYSQMKLCSFGIYDNDILVRDYIPCYQKSDNVAGLYDLVNDVFYPNAGTGTFLIGENVNTKDLNYVPVVTIENPNPPKLPSEFQEVEYIESTGTQYIDTGVNGTAIGTYEIKFNPLGSKARDFEQYFAGDKDFPTTSKLYVSASVVEQGSDGKDTVLFSLANETHTVSVTDTAILLDGVFVESYTAGAWGTLTYYIFNAHGEPNLMSSMSLYYLKMYSDGILVRDYVPCYRKADNVAGLYDLVNNVFYQNAGTGTFNIGNEIIYQPILEYPLIREYIGDKLVYGTSSDYTQIEYIESTGMQYIDTGFTPNVSKYTKVKANVSYTAPADRQMLCGFDYGHGFLFGYLNASNYFLNYMGDHSKSSVRATANQFYEIEQTYKSGSQVLIIDGNSILTTSLTFGWASYPLYVFSRNTSSGADALSKLKLRYLQIYDNDVLVRDYIPVIRNADNVAGLLDKINNVFYPNIGTGTFLVGSVVE